MFFSIFRFHWLSCFKLFIINATVYASAQLNCYIKKSDLFEWHQIQSIQFIMGSVLQKAKKLQYLLSIDSQNIFEANSKGQFTHEDTIRALKFAMGSNVTDYRQFHEVEHHMLAIISYLEKQEPYQPAEQLLSLEEEALWVTAKYTLFMFQKYLEKVVPTNITYYHFIRQKQFFTQYTSIRYVLVVGLHQLSSGRHVFSKLKSAQRMQLFKLLLQWLLTMIFYRCSAIYIKSNCVDHLIIQAHLLLSALLGYDSSSILTNLQEKQLKDMFNKLFYIEAFLLSIAIPTKNWLTIAVIINTIRKILSSVHQIKITMYLPSYLYANLIGFVKSPFTHEIIFRLFAYFLTIKTPKKSTDSEQKFIPQQNIRQQHLLTQCWSIISLLTEEYQFDKTVGKQLVLSAIPTVKNQSIIRAFILRISKNMHLDLQDQTIRRYTTTKRHAYLVGKKVIKPDLLSKNYHIAIGKFYLEIICGAAKKSWILLDEVEQWRSYISFNKYDIYEEEDYLNEIKSKGIQ